jgi:hypothetical protein
MLVGERAHISLLKSGKEILKVKEELESSIERGIRLVIEWISKGWTIHKMQLPLFYRESLATVLTLEKLRNLIETNIDAGVRDLGIGCLTRA